MFVLYIRRTNCCTTHDGRHSTYLPFVFTSIESCFGRMSFKFISRFAEQITSFPLDVGRGMNVIQLLHTLEFSIFHVQICSLFSNGNSLLQIETKNHLHIFPFPSLIFGIATTIIHCVDAPELVCLSAAESWRSNGFSNRTFSMVTSHDNCEWCAPIPIWWWTVRSCSL